MAYGNYFPVTYQPNYYGQPNPYYQQMQQQQAMMQQAQAQQAQQNQPVQQPTIQQSGFVLVQSEQEARSYPVAPGNSITFKDETAPFCYVKTMGFSSLDRPTFERYRLVKEESPQEPADGPQSGEPLTESILQGYATKEELAELREALEAVKAKLTAKPAKKAKEVVNDDAE